MFIVINFIATYSPSRRDTLVAFYSAFLLAVVVLFSQRTEVLMFTGLIFCRASGF